MLSLYALGSVGNPRAPHLSKKSNAGVGVPTYKLELASSLTPLASRFPNKKATN